MERWTFLIIADPTGVPASIRLYLRSGNDPTAYPGLQVALDGSIVELDHAEHDYEAPEWKAVEIFTAGGGSQSRWDQLKDQLRNRAAA